MRMLALFLYFGCLRCGLPVLNFLYYAIEFFRGCVTKYPSPHVKWLRRYVFQLRADIDLYLRPCCYSRLLRIDPRCFAAVAFSMALFHVA